MKAYRIGAVALGVIVLAGGPYSPAKAVEIGTTLTAQNQVQGVLTGPPRRITTGDQVHQNETVSTGTGSAASFRFMDDTTLSLGAGSSIRLDRFVYDPNRGASDIVFAAARGAFRFVTGKANKPGYRFSTPTASIGVRGTDFDLYIDRGGSTMVLARGGEAIACPRGTSPNGNISRTCCQLGAAEQQPVYGLVLGGSGRCDGPYGWDGATNPMAILSAAASTPQADFNQSGPSAPAAAPDPPSPPAEESEGSEASQPSPGPPPG
jgi:hypothetical protein